MAGYPQWTTDFLSPFLQRVQALGFNRMFAVDARNPIGFFQLVGYMVALHASKKYTQIAKPMERWSQQVAAITAAYSTQEIYNPEWWMQAGEYTKRTILDYYAAKGKGDQVVAYQQERPVTHNAQQFLGKFAEDFWLCLVWMESQRDDCIEYEFMPNSRDEIALCVYLAEEKGTLFLLIHQEIEEVPTVPQPSHYILTCQALKHLTTKTKDQQRSSVEDRVQQAEELQRKAEGDMLNVLACLVLDCSGLADTAQGHLRDLTKSIDIYKKALKVTNASGTTQLDLLEKVAVKQIKVQKTLPRQHSVANCAKSDGSLITICSHKFHEDCMRIYVESLFTANMTIVCPVDSQQLSLIDIRKVSIKVHDAIQAQKQLYTAYYTTHQNTYGSPQSSIYLQMQTMPMIICGNCHRQDMFRGGHSEHLCRMCFHQAAQSQRVCPVCNYKFTNEELLAVNISYHAP